MSFVLFLIFTLTIGPLIIWGLMHEDMLIKIEDRIIAEVRSQVAENRRKKNIKVVSDNRTENVRVQRDNTAFRGYVA